ncbi:uroporphyrinogen-III C-methyltransferase [Agromyces sp. H3Y2-19a]|uniref:uroporphyrinogen-III C-methyltransferase n=1 Tax=Agromyces chromiiresistens TaxID=3030835 RepID=UPI0023B89171|nr:uroporphyrinogen-III C-methyltransferase [Agromyces chromiiresistens]MDF0515077.1 uroporphyrinogen-III C-methyltransferase [Agromyces chromiiresistens]
MTGRVTLVGGGPGAVDLLTLRAARALADADVVLYDRLAPHDELAALAPGALLVDVGKRPGHHAVPQHEIGAMLVGHAASGAHVVRLKGGDPYVLGRGGEEVLACHAAGIPVDVVPGVTSAISVPAAAGIPLTHRGVSHAFTVVSGHAPLADDELRHLAGLGGTIVVLMGIGTLPSLAAGLARHGLPARHPVAVVERGCTPAQRTTLGTLGDIVQAAARARVASPAVVVVGEVVRLAHDGDASAAELMERAARWSVVA